MNFQLISLECLQLLCKVFVHEVSLKKQLIVDVPLYHGPFFLRNYGIFFADLQVGDRLDELAHPLFYVSGSGLGE